jgi:predicted DNA-binding protein
MPTTKKRINITVDDDTYSELQRLSANREQSLSRLSLDLIEQALELREDRWFGELADERLSRGEKRMEHQDAWS